MKVIYSFLLLFTICCTGSLVAQEGNYIRIVGLAEHTIEAAGLIVNMQLQEIKRDEYQKIREKNVDQIKDELSANLKTMGYSMKNVEEVWPPVNSYRNQKQENYTIKVKNQKEAQAISKFDIKGLSCTKFTYYYDKGHSVQSSNMAVDAMDDARRKAEALATKAGKKVGEVIHIEDKNKTRIMKPSGYNTKASSTFTYALTVTYELLD